MAGHDELAVSVRELMHTVTLSAACISRIEDIALRDPEERGDCAADEIRVADLLERTAQLLDRASVSLAQVYGAHTRAACDLAGHAAPAEPVVDRRAEAGSARATAAAARRRGEI